MRTVVGLDPSMNGTGCYKLIMDDDFNIIKTDYMSFTTVKRDADDVHIFHWKPSNFRNYLEKNLFMKNRILEFCKDCEYIGMEDYSFGSTGMVFDIAEFVGLLKYELYKKDKKIRLYDPNTVKMFASGKGNADKVRMVDCYLRETKSLNEYWDLEWDKCFKTDLSFLPKKYESPKADIIDAYYMSQLIRLELMIREGKVDVEGLCPMNKKIFTRVTKNLTTNLIDRLYLEKYVNPIE